MSPLLFLLFFTLSIYDFKIHTMEQSKPQNFSDGSNSEEREKMLLEKLASLFNMEQPKLQSFFDDSNSEEEKTFLQELTSLRNNVREFSLSDSDIIYLPEAIQKISLLSERFPIFYSVYTNSQPFIHTLMQEGNLTNQSTAAVLINTPCAMEWLKEYVLYAKQFTQFEWGTMAQADVPQLRVNRQQTLIDILYRLFCYKDRFDTSRVKNIVHIAEEFEYLKSLKLNAKATLTQQLLFHAIRYNNEQAVKFLCKEYNNSIDLTLQLFNVDILFPANEWIHNWMQNNARHTPLSLAQSMEPKNESIISFLQEQMSAEKNTIHN